MTENILTGNPNIKAIFASNDNMALGAVEALKAADKLKDVMVVGFDANPDAAASVLAGEMTATVAQAPKNMGAYGIDALTKLKGGGTVDAVDRHRHGARRQGATPSNTSSHSAGETTNSSWPGLTRPSFCR